MRIAKRIIVDPLMLTAINGSIPRLEVATGVTIPYGVIIEIDGFMLPCTGLIEYNDGHFEKFGKWPSPPKPVNDV